MQKKILKKKVRFAHLVLFAGLMMYGVQIFAASMRIVNDTLAEILIADHKNLVALLQPEQTFEIVLSSTPLILFFYVAQRGQNSQFGLACCVRQVVHEIMHDLTQEIDYFAQQNIILCCSQVLARKLDISLLNYFEILSKNQWLVAQEKKALSQHISTSSNSALSANSSNATSTTPVIKSARDQAQEKRQEIMKQKQQFMAGGGYPQPANNAATMGKPMRDPMHAMMQALMAQCTLQQSTLTCKAPVHHVNKK